MVTAIDGQPNFRQSVAVVIGINDYRQGITRLQSAVSDATRLATLLGEEHGYQVQLLTEQVTRQRLVTLFSQELPSSLNADDRLLVYFAGHGVADDGDDGPAGYILPQDARPDDPATFVAMTVLNGWLNALPCRHLLLVLDCCFAGAFRWSSSRQVSLVPRTLYRERYDRFIQDPAWQVLTSAADDQTAADLLSRLGTRPDNGDHSPFALALFGALSGRADFLLASDHGAPQGDGVITAPELYLYIRDQIDPAIPRAELHQTPGLWPLHRHGKGEYIFLVPGRQPDLPPAPDLTLANNPYRGLEPYNEQNSALFFGRDELTDQLQAVVEQNHLTVVTGVSGSGKSSLVKAGLLPKLRQTAATGADGLSNKWQLLDPVRPGTNPLQALATLFDPTPDTFNLAAQVQSWLAANPGKRLLLVIDQFEELVTLSSEAERSQLIQQLAALLALPSDAWRLVLTVRSDFEPHFANGLLKQAWAAGRFVVTAMTQDELREVIVQPAAARVLYFEPDELVDRIINDVVQMPGALPLLSFTMSELYLRYLARHADNRAIVEADYDTLGGVAGALRTRADAEYEALAPQHQITMQRLLLRMVSLQGTELARRRVSRSELDYATPGESERVNEVILRLVAARLLVTGQDETGDSYVEPAHDALIQAWDKLWNWVRAEQENLLLQRRLTPAAMDWERGSRAVGLLWDNDPRLRQAEAVSFAPESWLNRVETDFVAASTKRRQFNQQRLIWSLVIVIAVLTALTIYAFFQRNLAITESDERARQEAIAIVQRDLAKQQAAISRSRELAVVAQAQIETDPERAILIALEANTITRTFESEDVLRRALSDSPLRATFGREGVEVLSADFTTDRLLLTGAAAGKAFVQLLDLDTRQLLVEFDAEEATSIDDASFSPDGTHIAALGDDGFVRVWNVTKQQLLWHAPGHSATWSPDGNAIAIAGDNLAADLWNVKTGELITTVGERNDGVYENIHFSPDGKQLVTTHLYPATDTQPSGYIAKVWDISNGELVTEFPVNRDVAFSPDGKIVAYARDGTALLRDTEFYDEPRPLTEQNFWNVLYQHFSPTGHYLVLVSTDRTVRIWRVDDIQKNNLFRAIDDAAPELAEFSPDERVLVTVSGAEMQLRDIATDAILATLHHGERRIHSVRFSPDGRYLLSVSDDGTMRLWSTRLGEELAMIPAQTAHFAPNSALLATATEKSIHLWDIANHLPISSTPVSSTVEGDTSLQDFFFSSNGERIYAYGGIHLTWWDGTNGQQVGAIHVISGTFTQVALTADEQTIATVTQIERQREDVFDSFHYSFLINLWDTATRSSTVALQGIPDFSTVDNLAFSPDGTLLLVAGATTQTVTVSNRLVRVWDVATGALRYGLDFARATRAQFSPNGEYLVTTTENEAEIALWNATDGTHLARIATGNIPISAEAMTFTNEGTHMVAPDGLSSTARLWDLTAQQAQFTFNGHSSRIAQLQLAGDGALLLTRSPGDGSVRLWDTRNGEQRTRFPLNALDAELSPDSRFLLAVENGLIGLYLVRFEDLLALAHTRITRPLTCEEKRDFLHDPTQCAVATPLPAGS